MIPEQAQLRIPHPTFPEGTLSLENSAVLERQFRELPLFKPYHVVKAAHSSQSLVGATAYTDLGAANEVELEVVKDFDWTDLEVRIDGSAGCSTASFKATWGVEVSGAGWPATTYDLTTHYFDATSPRVRYGGGSTIATILGTPTYLPAGTYTLVARVKTSGGTFTVGANDTCHLRAQEVLP